MAQSIKGLAAKSDREPEFNLGTQMVKGPTPRTCPHLQTYTISQTY